MTALTCVGRLIRCCALAPLIAAAPPALRAQEDELAVVGSAGLTTGYTYHGVQRASTSWQASLEGTLNQWRSSIWTNLPMHEAEPEERQLTLGYTWPTVGPLAISVSGTHYWFIDRPSRGKTIQSVQPSFSIFWNFRSAWRPSVTFAYDIHARTRTFEASLGYELTLKKLGAFLELRAYGGQVAATKGVPSTGGPLIRDAYSYYGADVRLPCRIGVHWLIVAEGSLAGAINQDRAWSRTKHRAGANGILSLSARFEK